DSHTNAEPQLRRAGVFALRFARPARDFQPRPDPGGALSLLDAKAGACISMAKLLEAGLWAMMESPIKPRSDRDVV
ncbi:hypothetical protein, partial [Chromobacterium vaccinii]|uniref:hypothetical protein n=1 Tax=Chromobacterium vaccinii TaxID=1108595 RepID=UPI001E51065E